MERDRFFKPDQAVEYGLIDRVIGSTDAAAMARRRAGRVALLRGRKRCSASR